MGNTQSSDFDPSPYVLYGGDYQDSTEQILIPGQKKEEQNDLNKIPNSIISQYISLFMKDKMPMGEVYKKALIPILDYSGTEYRQMNQVTRDFLEKNPIMKIKFEYQKFIMSEIKKPELYRPPTDYYLHKTMIINEFILNHAPKSYLSNNTVYLYRGIAPQTDINVITTIENFYQVDSIFSDNTLTSVSFDPQVALDFYFRGDLPKDKQSRECCFLQYVLPKNYPIAYVFGLPDTPILRKRDTLTDNLT